MRTILILMILTAAACAPAKPGTARSILLGALHGMGEGMSQPIQLQVAQPTPITSCTRDFECGYGRNCIVGYAQSLGHCI